MTAVETHYFFYKKINNIYYHIFENKKYNKMFNQIKYKRNKT